MAKTRLATCRHEAAHSVICEILGGKSAFIHIGKRGKSYCHFARTPKTPLLMGLALMAGSAAEHLWHGTDRGLVSAHDLADLKRIGFKGEDFRVLWEESQRLVRRNKKSIWKLASQLKEGRNRL